MATAYAALLSVMQIIDQLQIHPRPPIHLDHDQIQSLTQTISVLQQFVEAGYTNQFVYSSEADPLEMRIADAAHGVEDVIESYIVDRIHAIDREIGFKAMQLVTEAMKSVMKDIEKKSSHENQLIVDRILADNREISSINLYTALQILIDELKSVDKEAVDVKKKMPSHEYLLIVDQILADNREISLKALQILIDVLESVGKDTEMRSYEYRLMVDRILADDREVNFINLYKALQIAIDELESVKKEAMEVKEKMSSLEHQLPREPSSTSADPSSFDGTQQYTTMVGFDDILIQVLDKLTSQESSRQIISITGMGGIGKTILAKNVYQHQLVVQHFDFRAWVTISQPYNITKILLKVIGKSEDDLSKLDENELGTILHKKLIGIRYLVIMDDIWDIEIWDRLRIFLPDKNNGSRILITTRLSYLARQIDEFHNMAMNTLDEDNSWNLFCKHVFGKGECPLELEEIGKKIVEGCKGHPLSISVVGGLLARSKRTKQYWEGVFENLNSTVNLENDKHCLQILYTSYNNLPVHLKLCFLSMGLAITYIEEHDSIFRMVLMLGLEGFVKPKSGKSIEEAANEYIVELAERNLITIDWMVKSYSVHDLLKDLCLREGEKQKFGYVVGRGNTPNNIHSIRHIWVDDNAPKADVIPILESAPLLRSLYWNNMKGSSLSCSPLLRFVTDESSIRELDVQKVNLRMIDMEDADLSIIHTSISRFWNLQILSVEDTIPLDIWMMPSLRMIGTQQHSCLPDPLSGEIVVLKNLHSLKGVKNVKWSKEVVKRIPHLKHLKIRYYEEVGVVDYCLNNLGLLQQLKYLDLKLKRMQIHNLSVTFPRSLTTLVLTGTRLQWDDVNTKIGSLPLLHTLLLRKDSCIGDKWETVEFQFCSLKVLTIENFGDLENWTTESTHFPHLERLILQSLPKLEEIPSSMGDIPTLQLIQLIDCSYRLRSSAIGIKEEQEDLGNEYLQVKVIGRLKAKINERMFW